MLNVECGLLAMLTKNWSEFRRTVLISKDQNVIKTSSYINIK